MGRYHIEYITTTSKRAAFQGDIRQSSGRYYRITNMLASVFVYVFLRRYII